MSLLTEKSIIFIEFENILYDTDTFVIQKIYDTFKTNRDKCICTELMDKIERNGIEYIKYISQVKHNMNPLIEYMNDDIENKEEISYEIYGDIIYADYGSIEPFDMLGKTTIGHSIDMIMKDENFEKLYLYCKNPTPEICEFIYNIYDDARVVIITGDESGFLRSIPCTSYFIADATNLLDIIEVDHGDNPVEVYIPEYSFNMTDDTGTLLTNPPIDELTKGTSVNVNSIKLPIV